MSSYVTLLGSESVERAGIAMRGAADSISTSVSSLDSNLEHKLRQFEEIVSRFETAVDRFVTAQEKKEEPDGR